jgi:glycolate oxidase iron-sulfur subunit
MAEIPAHISDYIEKCVRCGSCKALCPTYDLRAIEPLSARGRVVLVGALMDGRIKPTPLMISRLTSCLLCGICEGSCPVGVGITDVVYHGLGLVTRHDRERVWLRRAMSFALRRSLLCFNAASLMGPVLVEKVSRLLRIPLPRGGLPEEPLSVGLEIFKPEAPVGRVAVFTGCAVNYIMPGTGRSLLRALFRLGFEVVLPAGEVCCGAPMRALGLTDEAKKMAEKNIAAFGRLKVEAVLSLCPTCTLAIGKQYSDIAGGVIENAMDATEFLARRVGDVGGFIPANGLEGKSLVYHAPCHLKYGLGVKDAPLEMMRALGLEMDVPKAPVCCGFNQNMADRGLGSDLLSERRDQYGGYDVVMSACPGCVEQLSGGLPDVRHVVDALDCDLKD